MSSLETRMRQANPIPDARAEFGDDEIAALLTLTRARSTDMDVKEMTTPVTPDEKRSRGWLIAVAAAAVVVLVVGAVLLLSGGTDDVAPATTPSTTLDASPSTTLGTVDQAPTTIAGQESPTTTAFVPPELDVEAAAVVEGIVAAINAGDAEAAIAPVLGADEVSSTAQGLETDQRNYIAGRWAYYVEIESTMELLGCTTTTAGLTRCDIARVSPFDFSSPDPELSVIQLRLTGDRVAYMKVEPVPGAWGATEIAFGDWIRETHPEAFTPLVVDFSDPQRSAELMRQYYPEWLESRDS